MMELQRVMRPGFHDGRRVGPLGHRLRYGADLQRDVVELTLAGARRPASPPPAT